MNLQQNRSEFFRLNQNGALPAILTELLTLIVPMVINKFINYNKQNVSVKKIDSILGTFDLYPTLTK